MAFFAVIFGLAFGFRDSPTPCRDTVTGYLLIVGLVAPLVFAPAWGLALWAIRSARVALAPLGVPGLGLAPLALIDAVHCKFDWQIAGLSETVFTAMLWVAALTPVLGLWVLVRALRAPRLNP